MPMTITEATAVDTVVGYFTGQRDPSDSSSDAAWDQAARDALALLADKAHQRLHAGFTGDAVREAWPHVEACPWQTQPAIGQELRS